ncbi:MAG: aspartokinase [Desulforhopalus sp.]|jgi:aspartokinase
METIAIYWEKQVKVYGILLKTSLTLVNLKLGPVDSLPWHSLLTQFENNSVKFELIASVPHNHNENTLTLILTADQLLIFKTILHKIQHNGTTSFSDSYKIIDLIYLHGPHFQERFGILSKAIEPLSSHKIEITLSGCAGNSMYIAIAEGLGKECTEILHNTFHTPTSA